MLRPGHYFPGQDMNEEIVLFLRRHWFSFLGWIIIMFVMIIVPIVIYLTYGINGASLSQSDPTYRYYLILGAGAYYLLVLAISLTAWINYYLNVVIITDRRLVDVSQKGLFNRKISEQSLLRVQDVSARIIGLFQTFLNYGAIFVETAGDVPNFEMPSIPNPSKVANTILKLHENLVNLGDYETRLGEAEGAETIPSYEHAHKSQVLHIDNDTSPNTQDIKSDGPIIIQEEKPIFVEKDLVLKPDYIKEPDENIIEDSSQLNNPNYIDEENNVRPIANTESSGYIKHIFQVEPENHVNEYDNDFNYDADFDGVVVDDEPDRVISKIDNNIIETSSDKDNKLIFTNNDHVKTQEGDLEDGKSIKL